MLRDPYHGTNRRRLSCQPTAVPWGMCWSAANSRVFPAPVLLAAGGLLDASMVKHGVQFKCEKVVTALMRCDFLYVLSVRAKDAEHSGILELNGAHLLFK